MYQKGNVIIITILIIALFATLGGAGYLFLQNRDLNTKLGIASQASPTPLAYEDKTAVSPTPQAAQSASPTATPKTVVVFESKASISATDLDQIQKRIVNPYLDYYKETQGEDYVASLTIGMNTQASKATYPYTAKAIYKVGAYNDFLIAKGNGGIDWWLPECLNGCNLSASFKAKYPEIAAKVQ